MATTLLCTYFSDRVSISGHDNPVFNNPASLRADEIKLWLTNQSLVIVCTQAIIPQMSKEVYSRQMLSGEHYNCYEEQESRNK